MDSQHAEHAQPSGETLGEQVYSEVRSRIRRGEWLPGTKLTLRALAEELGTSVQPVRYAIGKLTAEQALVLKPNSSVALPPIHSRLLDEIFSMRNMLEAEAARRSTERLTEEDLVALEEAVVATREHYAAGGTIEDRVVALNEVALILADRSGSTILAEQIMSLRTRTSPYYAAAMARDHVNDPDFVTFTTRLQNEFLMAVRRRHAVEAEAIRKADLYTFQHYIYRMLKII